MDEFPSPRPMTEDERDDWLHQNPAWISVANEAYAASVYFKSPEPKKKTGEHGLFRPGEWR